MIGRVRDGSADDGGDPIRYIGGVDVPTQLVGPACAVSVFEGHDVRSILDADGNPLFVARDVCAILGILNPSSALSRLDDDERTLVSTEGGGPGLAVVTEPGLYALLQGIRMRKDHPKLGVVRRFKRWVSHDVIPSIRKSGRYELQHLAPAGIVIPRTLPDALRAYADEVEARERAEVRASVAEGQALVLVERVEVLEPKAAQADHHRAADGLRSLRDFANEVSAWAMREHKVRVLQQEVFDFLAEIGLLIRGNTNRHNQPTKMAGDRDFVKVKVGERKSNSSPSGTKATKTSRLTPAGEGWAWDRIHKRITEHGSLRKPPATFALENRSSD
jgi:anti-repressor protein